jgi:SAM-dependent methyltransferase
MNASTEPPAINTSAINAWRHRIEMHNAQTMRARGGRDVPDLWSGIADNFRGDPRRTDDPVVNLVNGWLRPDSTVLDVGGGGGRYALPVALNCREVTVVEPSPAMVSVLQASAKDAGVENVRVVEQTWEEAEVDQHSIVFCANVVYGVGEIEPFVRKLQEKASEIVAIVVYYDAPLSMMSPLWEAVHQERRINLPALPELLPALWEMEIYPDVATLPAAARPSAPSLDIALQFARHFLYLEPGSEKDARLDTIGREMAVQTPDGGWTVRPPHTRPQAVVWWRKTSA